MRILSHAARYIALIVSWLRSLGAKVASAFRTRDKAPRPGYTLYKPAPGKTCIRSVRRQYRRRIEREYLKRTGRELSGRQWVKLRRIMRKRGMDIYALPTFVTKAR